MSRSEPIDQPANNSEFNLLSDAEKEPSVSQCHWCLRKFDGATIGGNAKIFCSDKCKNRHHVGVYLVGKRELEEGRVTNTEMRALYQRSRRDESEVRPSRCQGTNRTDSASSTTGDGESTLPLPFDD